MKNPVIMAPETAILGPGNNVAGLKQRINKKRSPVRNEPLKSFFVQARRAKRDRKKRENEKERKKHSPSLLFIP